MRISISFHQPSGHKRSRVAGPAAASGSGWDGVWIEVCKTCLLMFGMPASLRGIVCRLLRNPRASMTACRNIFNALIHK
ncbi:hypothetical protein, partial [Niallia sp. MER 6]|uniref:hypothetical protein n=1 Tax=Niallia sp. MER 6 TaxID=2939567 RepID=UPI00204258F5